jgi:hypothetical protein
LSISFAESSHARGACAARGTLPSGAFENCWTLNGFFGCSFALFSCVHAGLILLSKRQDKSKRIGESGTTVREAGPDSCSAGSLSFSGEKRSCAVVLLASAILHALYTRYTEKQ